jgi:dihydrofolate reductase
MRKIVYYVAMSLDGFIAGPNEKIDGYVSDGSGLETYLNDLKKFDTVIMGRKTYEFGFKFGIIPGMPAYEHMDHYIFSNTASYEKSHPQVKIVQRDLEIVKELKEGDGSDIYLCGGGVFAGWLLENELIDVLKIKLSPAIFGDGLKLFGNSKKEVQMELIELGKHDHGLVLLTYKLNY